MTAKSKLEGSDEGSSSELDSITHSKKSVENKTVVKENKKLCIIKSYGKYYFGCIKRCNSSAHAGGNRIKILGNAVIL